MGGKVALRLGVPLIREVAVVEGMAKDRIGIGEVVWRGER